MTAQEIDRILAGTLADYRLSGGEKRALGSLLGDLGPDEQQLGVLRHRAFALARDALINPQARQVIDWLEDVVKVLLPRPPQDAAAAAQAYFSPGHDCVNKIVHLFGRAACAADVCVFTITDDRISDALLKAHRRGVKVRVITDDEKALDRGSDIERLAAAGVPVRVDRTPHHMHHKFALFDGAVLLNGSYNWTRSAAEHNLENVIVTEDRRLLAAFAAAFERLWEQLG